MDGKSWDAEQRPVHLDQLRHESFLALVTLDDHSSGNAEIPIKPGMPDPTTVQLDAYLEISGFALFTDRSDLQAGRVEVPDCERDGSLGRRLGGQGERD